jgi:hypothetical protein
MANVKITKENLNEKSFTNLEVLEIISKLSMELDMCGFSRTLDLVEDLTGDRDFTERNCNF